MDTARYANHNVELIMAAKDMYETANTNKES